MLSCLRFIFNLFVQDYEKSNVTNAYDWRFKDELDQADQDFDNRVSNDS